MEPIEFAAISVAAMRPGDHHLRTLAALRTVIQYEINVIKAYEHAIRHLDDRELVELWSRVKADNERHVLELSEIMRALGEAPPHFRSDVRGLAMDALAEIAGRRSSAHALRTAGHLAARLQRRYERALDWDLPLEVTANLQANQADLRQHQLWFGQWEMSCARPG